MRYCLGKKSRSTFISTLFVIFIVTINLVLLPVFSYGFSEQNAVAQDEQNVTAPDGQSSANLECASSADVDNQYATTPNNSGPDNSSPNDSSDTGESNPDSSTPESPDSQNSPDQQTTTPSAATPTKSSLNNSSPVTSTKTLELKNKSDNKKNNSSECGTAQALVDAIKNGETEIVLTNDIVFDNPSLGTINSPDHSETVEIDGAGFSITAKISVVLPGNLKFVGDYEDSQFLISDGGDFFYEDGLEIDISGDNATAFTVKNDNYVYGVGSLKAAMRITLRGDNSIGIHYEGYSSGYSWFPPSYIEMRNVEISAWGTGCTGIKNGDTKIPVLVMISSIDASTPVDSSAGAYQYGAKYTSDTVHYDNDLDIMMPTHFDPRLGSRYNCAMYGFYVNEGEELDAVEASLSDMVYSIHKENGDGVDEFMPVYPNISVDLENVDASTPGEYFAGVTPTLPVPGLSFSNFQSGKKYKIPIYVMEKNKPYLAFAAKSWGDSLAIKPLMTIADDDKYVLYYRKGDDDWQAYAADDPNVSYYMSGITSCIYIDGIDYSEDYEFKMEVLNGDFAGETNVLKLPGGMDYYKDSIGGDWDGDDQKGQNEQPPTDDDPDDDPKNPDPTDDPPKLPTSPKPNPQNRIGNEGVAENNRNLAKKDSGNGGNSQNPSGSQSNKSSKPTTLTTSEIKDVLKKKDELVFIKNGIKVIISPALLDNISVYDSKTFGVNMDMTDDGFYVNFFKDDKQLDNIEASQYNVHVPYQYPANMKQSEREAIDKSKVTCQKGAGTWPALEITNDMIKFRLSDVGTFTLTKDNDSMVPVGNVTKSTKSPTSSSTNNSGSIQEAFIFAAILLMIAVVSVFLYRRRTRSV